MANPPKPEDEYFHTPNDAWFKQGDWEMGEGRHSKKERIQREWEKLHRTFETKLRSILKEVEKSVHDTDWYLVFTKIIENFKQKFRPLIGYELMPYVPNESCIICNLQPNCLEQPNDEAEESDDEEKEIFCPLLGRKIKLKELKKWRKN